MHIRNTAVLVVTLILGGLLLTPPAQAQNRYRTPSNVVDPAEARDCTVQKGPGGLIRGDQIPNGCVIYEDEGEPPVIYDGRNVYGVVRGEDGVLLPGNSIYHTPGPVQVILADGTLAGIRTAGPPQFGGQVAELPRADVAAASDRRFGSIERNFGSRSRNFGREPGTGLSGRD